nr:hypothetical protein [Nostoc sp. CmiSLP01]
MAVFAFGVSETDNKLDGVSFSVFHRTRKAIALLGRELRIEQAIAAKREGCNVI